MFQNIIETVIHVIAVAMWTNTKLYLIGVLNFDLSLPFLYRNVVYLDIFQLLGLKISCVSIVLIQSKK